jgi:hypothetical protein
MSAPSDLLSGAQPDPCFPRLFRRLRCIGRRWSEYLVTLQTLVSEARAQGKSGASLTQVVMPALTGRYGQWEAFKYLAEPNILQMDAELSGTKRLPQAKPIQ